MLRGLVTLGLTLSLVVLSVAQSTPTPTPVITLDRSVCFGSCPVYKVEIYEDGKVVYEGKEFVKKKGIAHSQITKQELEHLVEQFTKINYFDLKSEPDCPQSSTDHPSASTSLKWHGRQNVVIHYHGCSGSEVLKQLTELEDKIDTAVNSKQWIE